MKISGDGRVERFKARLVARGFTQREGEDFEDTFAPVIRLESMRALFALAAEYGLTAHLLVATNAFVGSPLDIPNWIEIPEGLEEFESTSLPRGRYVCELKQSLYGLRQAVNLWPKKLLEFIASMGFFPSTADQSIFIDKRGVIIAVYVDDILIFSKSDGEVERIKRKLMSFHLMTDSGRVSKILRIWVIWNKDGSISLDQENYTLRMLEEFEMNNSNGNSTPMAPNFDAEDSHSQQSLDEKNPKMFRRIISRAMYLATGTRPDISFTVTRISQHLATPTDEHLKAAKHLLRYLKTTSDVHIVYKRSNKTGEDILRAYSDAAFANSTNYQSTSGYVLMFNNSPICWSTRKQHLTAQSTTESEYIAYAAKHVVWVRHLFYSLRKSEIYTSRRGIKPTVNMKTIKDR